MSTKQKMTALFTLNKEWAAPEWLPVETTQHLRATDGKRVELKGQVVIREEDDEEYEPEEEYSVFVPEEKGHGDACTVDHEEFWAFRSELSDFKEEG